MALDLAKITSLIQTRHSQMDGQNHYEFFEVAEDAGAVEVRKAYRILAKTFHADRFSKLTLGDETQSMLGEIFQRITEANQVLGAPTKRSEYDASLNSDLSIEESEAALSSDDFEAIFAGEAAFRKGKAMLEKGEFSIALKRLNLALKTDEDNIEIILHHTYATFMANRVEKIDLKPKELDAIIDKITKIAKENPKLLPAQFFHGKVLVLLGKTDGAKRAFQKALDIDKKHQASAREIRLLNMRKAPKEEGGFLGKIKAFFAKK